MPPKIVLMVVAPKDFRDEEFFETKQVLESHGIKATTASKNVEWAGSKFGKEVTKLAYIGEFWNTTLRAKARGFKPQQCLCKSRY